MRDILIVEDSRVQATMLRNRIVARYPDINVRIAVDPFEAREAIASHSPDLLLLDIELPKMSGTQFLGFLMRSHPLPVVIVTATVEPGSERESKLLELGSRRIIKKASGPSDFVAFDNAITEAIDDILFRAGSSPKPNLVKLHPGMCGTPSHSNGLDADHSLIALGSSTGGPKALEQVLSKLTLEAPPVFIAQHIPQRYVQPLIETLQLSTCLQIKLAEQGEKAHPGFVYVAPPDFNLHVHPGLRCEVKPPPTTCRFIPSVDVLFSSLACLKNYNIAAALLTGMGDDGAKGLLQLRVNKGLTIAQDEASCAVYGMPARAVELDAAEMILPISQIGDAFVRWYSTSNSRPFVGHHAVAKPIVH